MVDLRLLHDADNDLTLRNEAVREVSMQIAICNRLIPYPNKILDVETHNDGVCYSTKSLLVICFWNPKEVQKNREGSIPDHI